MVANTDDKHLFARSRWTELILCTSEYWWLTSFCSVSLNRADFMCLRVLLANTFLFRLAEPSWFFVLPNNDGKLLFVRQCKNELIVCACKYWWQANNSLFRLVERSDYIWHKPFCFRLAEPSWFYVLPSTDGKHFFISSRWTEWLLMANTFLFRLAEPSLFFTTNRT